MQKSEIINEFVDHVVDGMDMNCLIEMVKEYLTQAYQDMPDNEFFDMVKNESPYIVNFDF